MAQTTAIASRIAQRREGRDRARAGDDRRRHLARIARQSSAAPASSPRPCARRCSRGECDLVVHSLKDLPTARARRPRLRRRAQARRRPRRALRPRRPHARRRCPRAPASAPARRAASPSCAPRRPDLDVVDIRGNVDTRARQRGRRRASSTPWCSPPPGSAASARSSRDRATSTSTSGRPRPARARSPSRCAPGARRPRARPARSRP